MNSTSLIDVGLFRYLFLILWVWVDCVFQGVGPFHLSCWIFVHRLVILLPYCLFDVCGVYIDIPSFISNVGNLCLLYFFPCQSVCRFANIISVSEDQLWVLLMFSFIFLFSILFISPFVFIVSFPLVGISILIVTLSHLKT